MGKIRGDKFIPVDTLKINTEGFTLSETLSNEFNNTPGIYRLILGQTPIAKILNEPPQQLDFIFNNENITLQTDFNAPVDSLKILKSEENKIWGDFIKQEKTLHEKIEWAAKELDYYQSNGVSDSIKPVGNRFTRLQRHRDSLITTTIQQNPDLFASKLIKMYQEPFLDGHLTKQERTEIFRNEYLKQIDFSDESLINSPIYTDKIFKYLMCFAERGLTREEQEARFMVAVDQILNIEGFTRSETLNKDNNPVYELILDYLVRGFEKLNLKNVLNYIAENYAGSSCHTDETTTLERKLAFINQMKTGNQIPDFTINDINGDPIVLSQIQKEKTLIIFWTSWCPHCTEVLPLFKDWYNPEKNNTEIITISLDSIKSDWTKFITQNELDKWYNCSDLKGWDGDIATQLNIYATPTMILIDNQRKIISKPMDFQQATSAP